MDFNYFLVCFFPTNIDPLPFPDQLSSYGLTIKLLSQAFDCAQSGNEEELASCWSLRGIPYVTFYRRLHEFLKKWEKTRSLTTTSIGRFYISIDWQLQERGSSPSNTCKFIERIISSALPDTTVMSYNIADVTLKSLQAEVQNFQEVVHQLTSQMTQQQAELSQIKLQVKELSKK